MTDIITQAEQVIIDHTSDDVSYGELAQALADAGLLAEPARTMPNRAAIAQALYINHRDAIGDNATAIDLAEKGTDAVLELIRQRETKDVYELAAERIGTESTWAVDAREALGLTRTVPTRERIALRVREIVVKDYDFEMEKSLHIADAVLALLADQPTVAEAKAQALEEAAELTDNPHEDYWLRERAQQIRDGK